MVNVGGQKCFFCGTNSCTEFQQHPEIWQLQICSRVYLFFDQIVSDLGPIFLFHLAKQNKQHLERSSTTSSVPSHGHAGHERSQAMIG